MRTHMCAARPEKVLGPLRPGRGLASRVARSTGPLSPQSALLHTSITSVAIGEHILVSASLVLLCRMALLPSTACRLAPVLIHFPSTGTHALVVLGIISGHHFGSGCVARVLSRPHPPP